MLWNNCHLHNGLAREVFVRAQKSHIPATSGTRCHRVHQQVALSCPHHQVPIFNKTMLQLNEVKYIRTKLLSHNEEVVNRNKAPIIQ